MFKIGERHRFPVIRQDANFDRACEFAYRYALKVFGIDNVGNINNVKNADRSECALIVRFLSYDIEGCMAGINHCYIFEAYVNKGIR